MKFGFIIDNRKCIGCHACTTACKAEHQVPIGVNRTYVKQVEKGKFPNTRRLFSVMRCNHCTDAPCVEICPVEALFYRNDGIVDFNNDRCIGCKSCMQACPYDALYIDPDTSTAAKCNYCAHRVDVGLEPACVNVCPEHAIISGDMDNPNSEISQLLGTQAVKVRKPEKATNPNLFYIDADDASLDPTLTERDPTYIWSSQSTGVGHYAREAEKMAFSNPDVISAIMGSSASMISGGDRPCPTKSIDVLMQTPRRVSDTPDKGVLWGWEVSGYVMTKAISAGSFLVLLLGLFMGLVDNTDTVFWSAILLGLVFLGATGALLVKDLDRPDRFLNVLLRPQWGSWLVRGGYAITIYGGLLTIMGAIKFFELGIPLLVLNIITGLTAILVAIYTAFLFAQAKGRDFWQSPSLALHMLIHSFMAGAAAFGILSGILDGFENWIPFLNKVLIYTIVFNLFTVIVELTIGHPTKDAKLVVEMITKGEFKNMFWMGAMLIGNVIPLLLLVFMSSSILLPIISILVIMGIYFTEHIWVKAPQKIMLA